MGVTRRGRFGSYVFSILSFCTTLSQSGFAATVRSAEAHPPPPPPAPTRFTRAGSFVVGLEGLLNLTYFRNSDNAYSGVDDNGNLVHSKTTSSFLSFSTFAPKLALDGFVTDHVSVGLTAGFTESNNTSETTSGGQTYWSSQTAHSLDVTPRVGLAYVNATGAGIWIRGGFGVYSSWYENAPAMPEVVTDSSSQIFDTRFEVLGAFAVRRDIVVSVGPWIRKVVASAGDRFQFGEQPEDAPPSFGLTLGAGLVL